MAFEYRRRLAAAWAWTALCAVSLGLAACSNQRAAVFPSDQEIRAGLESVPTAAGVSALDRMAACGLTIDWADSSMTLMPTDAAGANLKSGDRILSVEFSAPNRPGQAAGRTEARARWRFRDDEILPQNAWATSIQQAKPPMGSAYYLDC